jgi:hypothetical protein
VESYDKVMSNLEKVKARGGPVIAVACEGDEEVAAHTDEVIYVCRPTSPRARRWSDIRRTAGLRRPFAEYSRFIARRVAPPAG